MSFTIEQREKISIEVIKVLVKRFESFPENTTENRNAPFHEAFLNAFSDKLVGKVSNIPVFISLASWQHGLNTTLGQTFFEKVAHILCDGEKREYTSKKLGNLQITKKQQEAITRIINNLSTSSKLPNLEDENNVILQKDSSPFLKAEDFSADVFYEDTDKIVAIELKTVQPNSSGMKVEKQKILEGKAALFHLFSNKAIYFYFGFPFDPTVNPKEENVTDYDKIRFLNSIVNANKFVAQNEVLVANELWNYLSCTENTMEELLIIINTIATTSFLSKFHILQNNSKRNDKEYITLLIEWNLISEKMLIENDKIIQSQLTTSSLRKNYNKMAFDKDGKYNWDRFYILKDLL